MLLVELLKWPSCLEVLGGEPHFVSNVKCNFFSASVLHLLLLGFQYVRTESPMSLCQSLGRRVCWCVQFLMWRFRCFELHFGVPMLHGPEWCYPSRSMHWDVVHEFRQKTEFGPVVLLVVADGSNILFDGLVLPLGLAVDLRAEGSWESVVDAHVGADLSPESASELRCAVCNTIVWYTMLADHVLGKHTCQFLWVDMLLVGQLNCHLC